MMNHHNAILWGALASWVILFSNALVSAEPPKNLLNGLDSEEFQERNKAYDELRKWAEKNLKSSPEQLYSVWQSSREPEVRSRLHELMKDTVVQRRFGKGKGFIGIHMQENVIRDENGKARVVVQISSVRAGSAGEKSGLKMNDLIFGVDKMDFSEVEIQPDQGAFRIDFGVVTRFGNYIKSKQPGETITLDLLRGKERMKVKVKLMRRPADADVGLLEHQRRENELLEREQHFRRWMQKMAKK